MTSSHESIQAETTPSSPSNPFDVTDTESDSTSDYDTCHETLDSLRDIPYTPASADSWMALVFQQETMKSNYPTYYQVIQDSLQSGTIFDSCVRYCQSGRDGKEFADVLLCTMQQVNTNTNTLCDDYDTHCSIDAK